MHRVSKQCFQGMLCQAPRRQANLDLQHAPGRLQQCPGAGACLQCTLVPTRSLDMTHLSPNHHQGKQDVRHMLQLHTGPPSPQIVCLYTQVLALCSKKTQFPRGKLP